MELTIDEALKQGVTAHKSGNLQEAERFYQAILQAQPTHSDASHNLGRIALSVNKADVALPLLKAALETHPQIEQFWLSYIDALIKENQFEEAKKSLAEGTAEGINSEKLDALSQELISKKKRKSPPLSELNRLSEHYQNERYDDAEKLALSLSKKFPHHNFSWNILSEVLKNTGRLSEAVFTEEKIVEISPDDPAPYYSLACTLQTLGRLDEAEEIYRKAIALKPDYAEAHNNLAGALQELDRLEEAEEILRQAIALKPDHAKAHNNLGIILKKLSRLEEAEESYRHAIVLKRNYAEAYNNLGVTLQELSRLEEAEESYRQAIRLKPDYAEAHNSLGIILNELGRLNEAEESYRQAIALKRNYADVHGNLGMTLKELGRLDEAEESYRQAIRLKPDYAEAHNSLGIILNELGRLDEAKASFRQGIALKPDYAAAHRHLAIMKKFDKRDEQFLQMQALSLDESNSEEQQCHLSFGLAKAYEDLGDFENSFKYYSEGNALRKKLLNYNISQDIEFFKQLKASYPQIEKNSLENESFSHELTPIFIVGMPRTGTTLVEQIISSHSHATGAGELPFVAQFGSSIARGLSDVDTNILLNFREKYLKKLQIISNDSPMAIDKMPHNFRYLGLLAAAFPEAKIVHIKRNPAAVCWGNYKQYFSSKALAYCYGLDDVVKYYALYENLMEFWAKSLTNRIYNLDYELLTINQEDETKKLIHYLGLDWEKKCLSPQDNTRSVATASSMQVREKVYQGSSQKWEKFKPFLNGAFDSLD